MSRGPHPNRTLERAIPVAEKRGTLLRFRQGPGVPCDFVITGTDPVAFVRVKRAERILCTVDEIGITYGEALLQLRAAAPGPAISKELWICSKHGTWRFFRVTNDGLTELDRDGLAIPRAAGK